MPGSECQLFCRKEWKGMTEREALAGIDWERATGRGKPTGDEGKGMLKGNSSKGKLPGRE